MELLYSRRNGILLIQLPQSAGATTIESIKKANLKGPAKFIVYPYTFKSGYINEIHGFPSIEKIDKAEKFIPYLVFLSSKGPHTSGHLCTSNSIRILKNGDITTGCSDCDNSASKLGKTQGDTDYCWNFSYKNQDFDSCTITEMEKQLEDNPLYSPIKTGLITPIFSNWKWSRSVCFNPDFIKQRRISQSDSAKSSWKTKTLNAKYCISCAASDHCKKHRYQNRELCRISLEELKNYTFTLVKDKNLYWKYSTYLDSPKEFWYRGRKLVAGFSDFSGNFIVSRRNIRFRRETNIYYTSSIFSLSGNHTREIPELPAHIMPTSKARAVLDKNLFFTLPESRFSEFGIVRSKHRPVLDTNILLAMILFQTQIPHSICSYTYSISKGYAFYEVSNWGSIYETIQSFNPDISNWLRSLRYFSNHEIPEEFTIIKSAIKERKRQNVHNI